MTGAIIYCRISKDILNDGLGVDRQERLCRELAGRRSLDVVDVYVDNDLTAFKRKRRPAFDAALAALADRRAGALVAYHVDRLYRRLPDLERIVDVVEMTGAQVHTVAAGDIDLSTASGRMIARMLGAAAQHESERIGERMRDKHDEIASHGQPNGGRPPYGYRREGKTFAVDPQEAEVVRLIARRIGEGASLWRIKDELVAAGCATREGRPWHHSTVRAVVLNPAVAGLRVHRRERRPDGKSDRYAPLIAGPGDWPAIVDRAEWETIRGQLADPARKRTRPARLHMLTGLVCTPGGQRMNGGRDKQGRAVYMTRTPKLDGDHTTRTEWAVIGADDLEAFVAEGVLLATDAAAVSAPEADGDDPAGAEVVTLEADLSELAGLRGAGDISLAEWMAARKPLQERLEAARQRTGRRAPDRVDEVLSRPGGLRAAWPAMDVDEKRRAIGRLVDRVVVGPATRGRWSTLDERLDPDEGFGIHWRA